LVQVTLPGAQSEPFVIRLPERGGLAPVGSGLPRGHLLLRVEPSAAADPSVSLAVSTPPFAVVRRVLSQRPGLSRRARWAFFTLALAASVLVAWLVWRR
jgi:hypothetical protein